MVIFKLSLNLFCLILLISLKSSCKIGAEGAKGLGLGISSLKNLTTLKIDLRLAKNFYDLNLL
jgi:hypothetical protein